MSSLRYMFDGFEDLDELEKDMDVCDRVFVYGTLQETHGNNVLLASADKLVRTETKEKFALGNVSFPYAFHPSVVPDRYKKLLFPVRGEVYKLNSVMTFNSLDGLEGYPRHYNRRIVQTEAGLTAWMYMQDDWSCAQSCDACHLVNGAWQWAK